MRKLLTTAMMALAAIVATFAQTANNDAAAIKWVFNSASLTEAPVFEPSATSDFFQKTEVTAGSGLKAPIAQTSTVGSITQTMFPVSSKTSSASDANAVNFLITLKEGIAFTPTKVSFKAFRWKTDKGNFDASWISDGTTKKLESGAHPNRGAGTNAAEASVYSYDLNGSPASEKQFGLVVNIFNFDVAADKGLSLGDVEIEGILYGTVGQPLTYTLTVSVNPAGAGTTQITPQAASYVSGSQVTLSQQPTEGYIFTGWQTESGKVVTTADSYTFNIKGNTSLTATYVTEESLQKNDYVVVDNITDFRAAIKQFNENPSAQRRFIFLKNGTYDYGNFVNTESEVNKNYGRDTLKVDNVSIIGQSTEGVTITITPTTSSVSRTAPIMIQSTGTYLQNITFHNNFDYSGNDGQAAALHDRGHHTIGKWLKLESRQDTYYSHTNYGQLYFEDTQFVGTVDFICGRGDVFFNHCDIFCIQRYPGQGIYTGDTHIAAPYTWEEDYNSVGGHGYIFMDCHVDCKAKTWDFGRGWRAWPKAAFLNTVLSADAVKRVGNDQTSGKAADNYAIVRDIDYSLRATTKGVKSSDDSESVCRAFTFYEYNTMDENGNVVSPASNVLTFTAADSKTMETILKPNEIDRFQLRNVFPDWAPDQDCKQVEVTSATLVGNNISWTADQKAKAFLIEKGGEFVAIVDGTQTSYNVAETSSDYTVRAANMMGGFGIAKEATAATGIENVNVSANAKQVVSTAYYSLSGARMSAPQHGAYIVVKTMDDGTVIATKETK